MIDESIVERRMRNTGETREAAVAAIHRVQACIDAEVDQSWVEEWSKPVSWKASEEIAQWLRERPRGIWPLLIQFPPSCVVRTREAHRIPAPGTVGIVRSWNENGTLGVLQGPNARFRGTCDWNSLEVVGYHRGWTPDRVREALGVGSPHE